MIAFGDIGADQFRQAIQIAQIFIDRRRMQGNNLRRLFGQFQFSLRPIARFAQGGHALIRFIIGNAALDQRIDHPIKIALGLGKPGFHTRMVRDGFRRCTALFFVENPNVIGDRFAASELFIQAADHSAFDVVQIIGSAVFASAGFLELRTYDAKPSAIAILDGHARAASAASEKPRKRMARLDAPARLRFRPIGAPFLRGLEQIVIDDP